MMYASMWYYLWYTKTHGGMGTAMKYVHHQSIMPALPWKIEASQDYSSGTLESRKISKSYDDDIPNVTPHLKPSNDS